MRYHAIVQKSGDWWIGWLSDLEGANAQERTLEELLESLQIAALDLLDIRGITGSVVEVVLVSGQPGLCAGDTDHQSPRKPPPSP